MSTNAQITANQQNAKLSTGPTTEAGKQISSQNATRHGFTGLSLIVTPDEKEAYETHVAAYLEYHQPASHPHKQMVQQYLDLLWSLHQIFVQQSNTMSLMNAVATQLTAAAGDPQATAAAIAPIARTLNTLNLYETRRRRALKTVKEELDAYEQAQTEAAKALEKQQVEIQEREHVDAQPIALASAPIDAPVTAIGFVYSDEEIQAIVADAQTLISQLEAQESPETVAKLRKQAGY